MGDDDGIVVVSDAELEEALETAEAIQRREGKIRSAIQDGTSLFEQLNFAEHVENLQGRTPELLGVHRGMKAQSSIRRPDEPGSSFRNPRAAAAEADALALQS